MIKGASLPMHENWNYHSTIPEAIVYCCWAKTHPNSKSNLRLGELGHWKEEDDQNHRRRIKEFRMVFKIQARSLGYVYPHCGVHGKL
jgi:hypothetical protein